MDKYTPQERAEIVTIFIENNRSIIATQRKLRQKYPNRPVPHKTTIYRLHANFRQYGTTADRPRSGRQRTSRNAENVSLVRDSVAESPETSSRRRGSQLHISARSLRRILKTDLKMFPYKIQLAQKLLPRDPDQRVEYSNAILRLSGEIEDFSSKLIMSDEAHFLLSGHVNKQNSRFWGTQNPQLIHETSLHPLKTTVWCGIHAGNIIGPYFFENDQGVGVTVTAERYQDMIRNFLVPEMEEQGLEDMWFQQDGATAHTARSTIQLLNDVFPRRLISRSGDLAWPARSPDLTAPDFFLWGFLKSKVYVNKPQTIQHLKDNIRHEIEEIQPEMLKDVMKNALKRAESCIANRGHHLADIIFQS